MFKTLDRYIALTFLKNFLIASGGLAFLYVFQSLLTGMINNDFPVQQLLVYNLLQVPEVYVQMAPPAVLIATVLTLSGFNRTNELVACYSIGIGLQRLLALFLVLVFGLCCTLLFFQDSLLPSLYRRKTNYYWREMKKRTDFHLDLKQNKIWYRSKNLIYNLKAFDQKSQSILGMSVYSFDDNFNLVQTVEAQNAVYSTEGWKLRNGTVTEFKADDPFPENQKFREIKLQIHETPKDFQEIEKEVDGLRLGELFRYIRQVGDAGLDTKTYQVKLHSRISLSFIPLVMCILGVPFSVRGRREGGLAKDLGICLGITFFYWLFYSIGLSLGTTGALPPFLAAWAPTLIFSFLALFLVSRQNR